MLGWQVDGEGEGHTTQDCEGLRKKKKNQEFVLQPGNIAHTDFAQPHAENKSGSLLRQWSCLITSVYLKLD